MNYQLAKARARRRRRRERLRKQQRVAARVEALLTSPMLSFFTWDAAAGADETRVLVVGGRRLTINKRSFQP